MEHTKTKENMTIEEKAWDEHSRGVPEDGYDINELSWVIGERVMLKSDFIESISPLLEETKKLREALSGIIELNDKTQSTEDLFPVLQAIEKANALTQTKD